MACNNGKKGFNSPYGMITDLNITYTGCSTTCNGEEIKPGMRLREILDILIGNCAEGGSATWGDIIGNIEDQTDLVQFIQDNISVANWGDILGDITDQEDLVQFVQENGFGEDKVGTNLHLDGGGKLNAGFDIGQLIPGSDAIMFVQGGEFPAPANKAYLLLDGGSQGFMQCPEGFSLEAINGQLSFKSEVRLLAQATDTTRLDLSPTLAVLSAPGGRVDIGSTSLSVISDGRGGVRLTPLSLFPDRNVAAITADGGQRRVGVFSSIPHSGGDNTTREIVFGVHDTTNNHFNEAVKVRYGQENPVLTDANEIAHKGYVDAQISTLQNTIDALEARIEALENA